MTPWTSVRRRFMRCKSEVNRISGHVRRACVTLLYRPFYTKPKICTTSRNPATTDLANARGKLAEYTRVFSRNSYPLRRCQTPLSLLCCNWKPASAKLYNYVYQESCDFSRFRCSRTKRLYRRAREVLKQYEVSKSSHTHCPRNI